jgi:hypothetical protein
MRCRIEECTKDVRAGVLKLLPKRMLRPALLFGNRCEHKQDSAVGKIGAGDDILDPVDNDGSGGRKQNFVLIGEQPTCRKGTAARQAAEGMASTFVVAHVQRARTTSASASSTSKLTAPEPLGLIEGATENAAVVQALIDNLVARESDPAELRA